MTKLVSCDPGPESPESAFQISGNDLIDVEPYASGNVMEVRLLPGPPAQLSLDVPDSQIYAVVELDDDRRIVSSLLVSPGRDIQWH